MSSKKLIFFLGDDDFPDLLETDFSEYGIVSIESSQILFFNGQTEVFIHRTFASPCHEITFADINIATEIGSCKTRTSKIEANKQQLQQLCQESWFNVTKALSKSKELNLKQKIFRRLE